MPVTACPRRVNEQDADPADPPTACVFLLGVASFIGTVRSEKSLFVQRERLPLGRQLAPPHSGVKVHLGEPGQEGREEGNR